MKELASLSLPWVEVLLLYGPVTTKEFDNYLSS